jgi:hypothetical protein
VDKVWEGKEDKAGNIYKFKDDELERTVKQFYLYYTMNAGIDNGSFVAIADNITGPHIPVEAR